MPKKSKKRIHESDSSFTTGSYASDNESVYIPGESDDDGKNFPYQSAASETEEKKRKSLKKEPKIEPKKGKKEIQRFSKYTFSGLVGVNQAKLKKAEI